MKFLVVYLIVNKHQNLRMLNLKVGLLKAPGVKTIKKIWKLSMM